MTRALTLLARQLTPTRQKTPALPNPTVGGGLGVVDSINDDGSVNVVYNGATVPANVTGGFVPNPGDSVLVFTVGSQWWVLGSGVVTAQTTDDGSAQNGTGTGQDDTGASSATGTPTGIWSDTAQYDYGAVVSYGTPLSLYVATTAPPVGDAPSDQGDWLLVAPVSEYFAVALGNGPASQTDVANTTLAMLSVSFQTLTGRLYKVTAYARGFGAGTTPGNCNYTCLRGSLNRMIWQVASLGGNVWGSGTFTEVFAGDGTTQTVACQANVVGTGVVLRTPVNGCMILIEDIGPSPLVAYPPPYLTQ